MTVAARALGRVGPPPVVVDLGRLAPGDDSREIAAAAIREARLRGTGLVAGPLDLLAERGAGAVRAWAEAACPVVLHGSRGWDPAWSRTVPFLLDADLPPAAERRAVWLAALRRSRPRPRSGRRSRRSRSASPRSSRPGGRGRAGSPPRRPGAASTSPTWPPVRGPRTPRASSGWPGASSRASPGTTSSCPRARSSSCASSPAAPATATWCSTSGACRGPRLKGRGVTALFAGDSGTGKTMSAEVIAGGAGPRPLRHRPVDRRRQVHRRDREEPRPHLHRGRPGQRRAALRRGGRDLRQALRGQGRPRPLRQRRGRLPAPADGAVRRDGGPDDEPPGERRRGVPPPARRDRRLPAPRDRGPAPALGRATSRPASRRPTTSTSTSWPAASRCPAATSATWPWRRRTSRPTRAGR